jgi:hypothetical protein
VAKPSWKKGEASNRIYVYVIKEAEPGTRWQTFLMHMGIGLLAAVIFFVMGSFFLSIHDPF